MAYVVGIDGGGTFTDCVILDDRGNLVADKAFTTPENMTLGVMGSIENAASALSKPVREVLADTSVLALGTTWGINRLVARAGAKVGLITTKGHEDAALIGRVFAKTEGLAEAEKFNIVAWDKPDPIVPRPLIKGITERIDYKGTVIVPLNLDEVRAAAKDLVDRGVEAIAVCFLWSFMNPEHEQLVTQIIEETYPHVFVTISSDLAPIMGEYERTATTMINAYLGPGAKQDMVLMRQTFGEQAFRRPFLVMQSTGGVIWDEEASSRGVYLLSSGPVGGVVHSATVGKLLGHENVIATDMGGTSFDVGLVVHGEPQFSPTAIYDRYRVFVPAVNIVSIGAGGGSIAWITKLTNSLNVGPQSAGSRPGPVCYDWGGTEPTVTDADLILGRINPNNFFGGRKILNQEKALEALKRKIAEPLGLDVFQAAKGVIDIVDAHMADLIRKVTVEQGHDPRDFVLFAYGGAGPGHVGAYAKEIGIKRAIVSPYAPVFSALGIASSEVKRLYTKSEPLRPPVPAHQLNSIFGDLEQAAKEDLDRTGVKEGITFSRLIDMRFRYQLHEVRVPVPDKILIQADVEEIFVRFTELYEQIFGRGTAYVEAGIEMVTFRLVCNVRVTPVSLRRYEVRGSDPSGALAGSRPVYVEQAFVDTPVFSQDKLSAGNIIPGPAILEGPASTVLVHPGQRATVDEYLNIIIELE